MQPYFVVYNNAAVFCSLLYINPAVFCSLCAARTIRKTRPLGRRAVLWVPRGALPRHRGRYRRGKCGLLGSPRPCFSFAATPRALWRARSKASSPHRWRASRLGPRRPTGRAASPTTPRTRACTRRTSDRGCLSAGCTAALGSGAAAVQRSAAGIAKAARRRTVHRGQHRCPSATEGR